jgi:hypothetical protein
MTEPVELVITRGCAFKKKEDGKRGCARCDGFKKDAIHLGAGPSVRMFGSGAQQVYQAVKHQWQDHLRALLEDTHLPRPCAHILVEGQMTFPDRGRRDQGNHRFIVEKALGDALVDGGWLEDDDWTRYEFGGLAYAYEKGVSQTRLMLFPG